jgi:heme-degrading monooxygenase HmoA
MTATYTTGTWAPYQGREAAFVQAWVEFATWASAMPGAGALSLTRDVLDSGRFVSFGSWESLEAVREWKASPAFRERMALVLQYVDEFQPSELAVIATAGEAAR